jgi:hypothetical protein
MTDKRISDSQTRRRSAQSQPAIAALARHHAEAALAALVEVMADRGATPAARISAASAVLNWGFGKAAAGDGEEGDNGPVELVIRWLTLQDASPPASGSPGAVREARAPRGSRS